MSPSFTIIGRGLAGAVLFEVLRDRGMEVRVFDMPRTGSASRVAAGVVNPVVLRRTVLSWRATELLPIAEGFYRRMEERYGVKLWHPLPLVKLFSNARERSEWEKKADDPDLGPLLSLDPGPGVDVSGFHAPFGCGMVRRCAWLDVPAFLDAQRERMLSEGRVVEEIPSDHDQRTSSNDIRVDCTGPFSTVPGLVPVKGETLTVHIPALNATAMVHRSAFLLPLGHDRYRLGSTFAWDDVWSGPTGKAKDELLRRLSHITALPVTVVGHDAGVRPTARDRRPILGSLQGHLKGTLQKDLPPSIVLNGLGSRGVLLAPWCAMHLADHLLDGRPIDPEVDAARFAQ